MATQDLITYLPGAWPWAGGILALALPRLVRELRRLIYARAVSRLGKAAIDKTDWSDERFKLVIKLIHDVDRNSASRRSVSDRRSGKSEASDPPGSEES